MVRLEAGNGSISVTSDPHVSEIKLDNMLEVSYGPKANSEGIKSCLTYNPPGGYQAGFQEERSVSI